MRLRVHCVCDVSKDLLQYFINFHLCWGFKILYDNQKQTVQKIFNEIPIFFP